MVDFLPLHTLKTVIGYDSQASSHRHKVGKKTLTLHKNLTGVPLWSEGSSLVAMYSKV